MKAAPKPKREECEVGPELEPLLVQWWDRLGTGADASRSRQALKAELAAEEAKGRQQRQEAETARCQDLEMLRVVLGGRVLALDLSSSLRDVRLLGACGSAAALAEALSELLLSLRRAAALCGAHRQEKKQKHESRNPLICLPLSRDPFKLGSCQPHGIQVQARALPNVILCRGLLTVREATACKVTNGVYQGMSM